MGYNYYILIQGRGSIAADSNREDWIDLQYYDYSGSYSGTDQHYFFTHASNQYQLVGNDFSKEMGDFQYVFTYETLTSDYKQYVENYDLVLESLNLKDKLHNIAESKLTIETIMELHDCLTNIIEAHACYFREELEIYYMICKELHSEYQDVRIIFGLSP